MAYPSSLDNFTPKADGVDYYMAQDVNELQTAVEAIETELGTDPAGTATDVKTRLSKSLSDGGYVQMGSQVALTINAGAVTVTQNLHTLDTEGGASSDYLDTINGGGAGWLVFLRPASNTRAVIVRHNVGNILCPAGNPIELTEQAGFVLGFYDSTLSKWLIGSAGSNVVGSASLSPSASVSPSSSVSPSVSPSASVSPSVSPSASVSPS